MALLDERADRGTEEGDAMGMINVEYTSERADWTPDPFDLDSLIAMEGGGDPCPGILRG